MADIIQLHENTWVFEDKHVRFYLLQGLDRAAMIDSGIDCPEAIELAKKLTDKPIILLNTHGDMDHVSGTGGFREVYMHPDDYRNCGIKERFPETTLVEIADGDEIDLGGRPLKIVHIPGHTSGSVAILDVNNRILIAGDTVQKGHIFLFGNHREPDKFKSALDKLIAMQDEYDAIYASHSELLLPNDYAKNVKKDWKRVLSGEISSYENLELHGRMVRSYTGEYCGFYVE